MYQYLVYGFSLQQLSQLNLLTDNKKLYILCTLVKTVHFFCFYLRNVKLCVLNSTIKMLSKLGFLKKVKILSKLGLLKKVKILSKLGLMKKVKILSKLGLLKTGKILSKLGLLKIGKNLKILYSYNNKLK